MKQLILSLACIALSASSALASSKSERIANIFARGVYAQMDRSELAENPKAKIEISLQESHASSPGNEVYKAFRRSDNGTSCGTVIYVTNGVPALMSDVECSK